MQKIPRLSGTWDFNERRRTRFDRDRRFPLIFPRDGNRSIYLLTAYRGSWKPEIVRETSDASPVEIYLESVTPAAQASAPYGAAESFYRFLVNAAMLDQDG
jgi:hypothetical protein